MELNLENKKGNKMNCPTNEPTQLIQRINNDFTYHCPPPERADVFTIRNKAKELATLIAIVVPSGREQSTALTRLEETVFHANAGIARQYPKE